MSFEDRTGTPIEAMGIDWRSAIERSYQEDPLKTHSELVSRGFG